MRSFDQVCKIKKYRRRQKRMLYIHQLVTSDYMVKYGKRGNVGAL